MHPVHVVAKANMTFPQYLQYPQRPQQPHPQQNPQQPSQYQQQPQYPQPQANPYELWLRRVKSVFSRIGAGMCLMVVIWYALATVLSGVFYQVLHTTNLPNWAVYVASDTPLYLVAMPLAVLIMGKSSVIETRKFDMKRANSSNCWSCASRSCMGAVSSAICWRLCCPEAKPAIR